MTSRHEGGDVTVYTIQESLTSNQELNVFTSRNIEPHGAHGTLISE